MLNTVEEMDHKRLYKVTIIYICHKTVSNMISIGLVSNKALFFKTNNLKGSSAFCEEIW